MEQAARPVWVFSTLMTKNLTARHYYGRRTLYLSIANFGMRDKISFRSQIGLIRALLLMQDGLNKRSYGTVYLHLTGGVSLHCLAVDFFGSIFSEPLF